MVEEQTTERTARAIRGEPQGILWASAVVRVEGRATEHIAHSLSPGSVQLCGVPAGKDGDPAEVTLRLPTLLAQAHGWLRRIDTQGVRQPGSPGASFAIEFRRFADGANDAIREELDRAGEPTACPRILLIGGPQDANARVASTWLAPVLPICACARTPLDAVSQLCAHRILYGLLAAEASPGNGAWPRVFPAITWRRIDHLGRMHRRL